VVHRAKGPHGRYSIQKTKINRKKGDRRKNNLEDPRTTTNYKQAGAKLIK